MGKNIVFIAVALVITMAVLIHLSGCSGTVCQPIRPLSVGSHWIYEVTDSMNGQLVSVQQDTVRIDTVLSWGGEKWFGQKSRSSWFQRNGKDGLYTLVFDPSKPEGYAYLGWKYPAKAGDNWRTKDTVNVELVSTNETVTTPAGLFENNYLYRIHLETPELGLVSEWLTWRKPGVGTVMVRTVSKLNGQTGSKTEKLISYTINE